MNTAGYIARKNYVKYDNEHYLLYLNENAAEVMVNPETKEKLEPIKAELTIKQSLFHISCIMKTTEMKSQSITAGFNIVPDDQVYQMVYTYMSIPKQNIQERSRIHYGTIIFDMQNNCDCNEMTGNYWTGRNTNGFIRMEKK